MTLQGFYVSFSGESKQPISNLVALSPTGSVLSQQVLDASQSYQELRGMTFDAAGRLYVCQAHRTASAVLRFAAQPQSGYTRSNLGSYVTPKSSTGLWHPYQPTFGPDGNLYVSSQDTNVVTSFFGPDAAQPGSATPISGFLSGAYPSGTFNPGTFVAAFSAAPGSPSFTPVPVRLGGLTFASAKSSSHSVRGLAFDDAGHLFVADEGNNRVAVFDNSGQCIGSITASRHHPIAAPVALWFSPTSGLVLIGSPGNQRVFTFDPAGIAKGDFEAHSLLHDATRLDKLSGITSDADGHVYTCSRESRVIYRWSADGTSVSTFAGPFDDAPEQIIPVYAGFSC